MRRVGAGLALVVCCAQAIAQIPPQAVLAAQSAYDALKSRNYPAAVSGFQQYLRHDPNHAGVHKDLAYTLLKIGENAAARDQFAAAVALNPDDTASALEYAFLCNETHRQPEARRTFDRLRQTAPAPDRETAAKAFENIDRPLREGLARWQAALIASPENFSAHEELACLAEMRDDLPLARTHYQAAVRLRPDRTTLLLDLARVHNLLGDSINARATYVRAAASPDPRVAETARQAVPDLPLTALLSTAAPEPKKATAKDLGIRSLDKSFLADALRYLTEANQQDPTDAEVMLKLGWAHNQLGQDELAAQWFNRARRSTQPKVAAEARRAWLNLRPGTARVRLTTWLFPIYSSRWQSTFLYGQTKVEFKLKQLPFRPYLSARVVGDFGNPNRQSLDPDAPLAPLGPLYLSERAIIPAVGIARSFKNRIYLWAEAGEAISYSANRPAGRMVPDYRGGISYARGWGQHLTSEGGGFFHELESDAVFVSRFANDIVFVAQNRTGYTTPPLAGLGGLQAQAILHWNGNADRSRQYWANFVEAGPGARVRFSWMPPSLFLSAQYLYGWYTVRAGNPHSPQYRDLRLGLWYAFSH